MRQKPHLFALPRHARLRRGGDFQAVFQHGRRIERRSFVALWQPAGRERQAGFTVSRQVRGAVSRNRVRRRLREAYRRERTGVPVEVAVVFVGRSPALMAPFELLQQEMRETMAQIKTAAAPAGAQ
jgi:ribonuclease P protein component